MLDKGTSTKFSYGGKLRSYTDTTNLTENLLKIIQNSTERRGHCSLTPSQNPPILENGIQHFKKKK